MYRFNGHDYVLKDVCAFDVSNFPKMRECVHFEDEKYVDD